MAANRSNVGPHDGSVLLPELPRLAAVDGVRRSSYYQDAVRILFLLDIAGEMPAANAPAGAVAVVRTQTRLQALDFWVRNPDYLAGELLTEFAAGRGGTELLDLAGDILNSGEPELHRYPMTRWLYGAYEPLDNALAILMCVGFVEVRRLPRGADGHDVARHDYYLLAPGRKAADDIVATYPELGWYRERTVVVLNLAGGTPGPKLKERQHLQATYHGTPHGVYIQSIENQVRKRLHDLRS